MYLCSEAEDWLTLTFLPGLGSTLINRLIQETGSPKAVVRTGSLPRGIPGIGSQLRKTLASPSLIAASQQRARRELDLLHRHGISLLSLHCSQYPPSLRNLPDPPVLLYCRGETHWLKRPAVAVIGARSATEYGRRISSQFAAELAATGITVVSGGAHGIDAAAHIGALTAPGGGTVAVLGCGVDKVYPPAHAALFKDIAVSGMLLSEYPLGTAPEGFRFPARNRIISGLVQGVVVVEATEKSGSLITAKLALEQGREVFAVPGRIDSPKSRGTHSLIQQGACLVQSVQDIVEGLSWKIERVESLPRGQDSSAMNPLAPAEEHVLACLDVYALDIEEIVRKTGLELIDIHPALLGLELKGYIRQVSGQRYEKLVAE
ncbi:DNA-processing protein DprA [Desulfobulbus alkaliphilus]|uniref:DNA-processing protein DprA n=1 Tax=Desulfobulbus alkaliphilus TaxID=869814 RepID=UPI001962C0C0|nr:DNA-processing protein DprA [Desulfobulbus alkaliphilus]MBM9536856.1 DNA-processing protein DprA [Desulfobulbus alkaliphilus]